MLKLMKSASIVNDNTMSIVCTGCKKATSFVGLNCPIVCGHCGDLVPDAIDLHYDKKERIVYHQDTEIFD